VEWTEAEPRPTRESERAVEANPNDPEHNKRVAYTVNYALEEATKEYSDKSGKLAKDITAGDVVSRALDIITTMRRDEKIKGGSEGLILRDAQRYLYGRTPNFEERVFAQIKELESIKNGLTGRGITPEQEARIKEWIKAHPEESVEIYEKYKKSNIRLNAFFEDHFGWNPGWGRTTESPPSRPGGMQWFRQGLIYRPIDQIPPMKDKAPILLR
jgi:hypothetical protein